MTDIAFIKTSSLGDVIHNMPALTDARRAFPHARFTWVVEEAYVPLVRLHPDIDEVIPVASRRWRHAPLSGETWRQVRGFSRKLRGRVFDAVVDTQGLLKTGIMTRLARGIRHGYDSQSIREPVASLFYDVRHQVSRAEHAVIRNRMLAGLALGYALPMTLDYGLRREALMDDGSATRSAILFHGTARAEKEWPEDRWISLAQALSQQGFDVLLPWGTEAEHARSARIAAQVERARVLDRTTLDVTARHIAAASCVIGVDTGLLHLAAALSVPLVAIFTATEPGLTGPMGAGPLAVVGGKGKVPSVEDVLAALP